MESTTKQSTFVATILTPCGKIFEGEIESISAYSTEGSLGILAHHAPIIARLVKGRVKIRQHGEEIIFETGPGILEVNGQNHNVLILVDDCKKL